MRDIQHSVEAKVGSALRAGGMLMRRGAERHASPRANAFTGGFFNKAFGEFNAR